MSRSALLNTSEVYHPSGFPAAQDLSPQELSWYYESLREIVKEFFDPNSVPGLTYSEAIIARALRKAPGILTPDTLYNLLYHSRRDSCPETKTITQFITLINRKSRTLGWRISSRGRSKGFQGYYMTSDDKRAFDVALKEWREQMTQGV